MRKRQKRIGPIVRQAAKQVHAVSSKQTMQRRLAEKAFGSLAGKCTKLAQEMMHAASPTLTAFLPASLVVILPVLFFGAVVAVWGSPMDSLFADESNSPHAISSIVQETNKEFGQAIHEMIAAHPECSQVEMHYDNPDGVSWAGDWPGVLAVFAASTNLSNDRDVMVMDENKKQQLQDIFWRMHSLDSSVETVVTEVEIPDEKKESIGTVALSQARTKKKDPQTHTEIQTRYTLHITVSSKTVAELETALVFNPHQRDMVQQLLSDEMRPHLVALVGVGMDAFSGTLQWPLPGYMDISTEFGAPDAFGRPGHKGVDIPAPAGTPILAAHSGTVQLAAQSSSYGNQVLLDSGDGTTTRYAHMRSFLVAPGQKVAAGEVMGYVGSTGASTGNHLHFEVMLWGTPVDPLQMFL